MLVSTNKKTEPENCTVATRKFIFQLRRDHEWNNIHAVQLTHFHKIWYEQYANGGHPAYFLIFYQ
jgi:hypothetical protein